MPLMQTYALLAAAIVAEVIGTIALAQSDAFTRRGPAVLTVLAYALAFYLLSYPLRTIPTGVVYAIWSGLGVVLITAISWVRYGQTLDAAALAGLALIVAGVVVINAFSSTVGH